MGEDGVVVDQEDVGRHEVGVAAEGALEVGALEAIVVAVVQEGSVAVEAEGSEEVVTVSEGNDIRVCVLEMRVCSSPEVSEGLTNLQAKGSG